MKPAYDLTARATPADAQDLIHPFGKLVHLTSFVGRETEVSWVRARLEAGQRLLTITGPGGVGKTRLASAVAETLERSNQFPGGVAVVAMAPVSDEALVLPTIARSLGVVAEDDRTPVHRLAAALRDRRMLLVLDNLEHVIGSAVELSELRDLCPDLSMLVTSRRALRLHGEQEFALSPLPLPNVGHDISVQEMAAFPAVALFIDRAMAADPSFRLTTENTGAVLDICSRLDGLPLAIELAAARIKILSPRALASRLTGRLQLLTTGPRDAPLRQQTLRDTIGWSYDLLSPGEQALFRDLSVFAGGATLEAIDAVAGTTGGGSMPEILDDIAALVDQSLLVQEIAPDDEPRFRMLETIREFALDALESEGTASAIRDAHARYFVHLAEYTADGEYGPDESRRILRLEPDLDNVRAALTWLLVGQDHGSERARLGLRLAGAMVRFWDVRGYLQEEADWLRRALDMVPAEPTQERGTALTALGVNAWFHGHLDESLDRQQQALDVWRKLGHQANIVRSLWFLGLVAGKRKEVARLLELYEESAPLAPQIGPVLWARVPESLLSLVALAQGDGAKAIDLMQATLSFHEDLGFLWPHAWCLGLMAEAAMVDENMQQSLSLFQKSLVEFFAHGDLYATLDGIVAIVAHVIRTGDHETAARLLVVVLRMRARIGKRITWSTVNEEEALASVRQALGDARFAQLQAEAAGTPLAEAVDLAMTVRPQLAGSSAPAPAITHRFGLSKRELEVLELLTRGLSNQEIGQALYISPRTAGTHVANILAKLGVNSRAGAVATALNQGLI